MKQKFENEEPLDFEHKPVKRSFQLVFSTEGMLMLVLIVCMYMAYLQYVTDVIPWIGEAAMGLAAAIYIVLVAWQLMGLMESTEPTTAYNWKIIHSKIVFFIFVLLVLTLLLMLSFDYLKGFATFLVVIQQGLNLFYMINCFIERKNEPEIPN
jgi:hypothetical protein